MRKIGKVLEFDGYSGELVDKDEIIHVFTKEDLNMLPYGQKIGAFLTKIGIYS